MQGSSSVLSLFEAGEKSTWYSRDCRAALRAIIRNPSSVRRGGKIGERRERAEKVEGEEQRSRKDEGREGRDRSQIERRKNRKRKENGDSLG